MHSKLFWNALSIKKAYYSPHGIRNSNQQCRLYQQLTWKLVSINALLSWNWWGIWKLRMINRLTKSYFCILIFLLCLLRVVLYNYLIDLTFVTWLQHNALVFLHSVIFTIYFIGFRRAHCPVNELLKCWWLYCFRRSWFVIAHEKVISLPRFVGVRSTIVRYCLWTLCVNVVSFFLADKKLIWQSNTRIRER